MRFRSIALPLVFTLAAVVATGQDYRPRDSFMMGGYGGYSHASTAEEGALRGMGDLTRSMGAANLMNSEAAGNWEDARTKYMQNRQYGAETYFEMRDMNRRARDAERGPRPTQEDAARFASARVPRRLSLSELDPLSGQVKWPEALQDPAYAQPAGILEQGFEARAKNGYLTAPQRTAVKDSTDQMLAILKANIDAYSPQDYVNIKKFIQGLGYELYATAS